MHCNATCLTPCVFFYQMRALVAHATSTILQRARRNGRAEFAGVQSRMISSMFILPAHISQARDHQPDHLVEEALPSNSIVARPFWRTRMELIVRIVLVRVCRDWLRKSRSHECDECFAAAFKVFRSMTARHARTRYSNGGKNRALQIP